MDITGATLRTLGIGFKTNFQTGFKGVEPSWQTIATLVPSTTAENDYGWLGDWPNLREWIGDRVVKQLAAGSYTLRNRKFESTVGVKADHISDDNLGIYAPRFAAMGEAAAKFPDQLVWSLLTAGFDTLCYDGQNFFDTDHPVVDPDTGKEVSVSNMQAGAETPWFLLDTTRSLKPLIYQEREKPGFVAKEDPNTSDHVFMKDEFLYGTKARGNAGFGFWQMAFGSKAEMTEANLDAAYDFMTTQTNDEGNPLGVKPNLLVVGGTNRKKAQDLLKEFKPGGETNTNHGLVDIHVSPWLR